MIKKYNEYNEFIIESLDNDSILYELTSLIDRGFSVVDNTKRYSSRLETSRLSDKAGLSTNYFVG